MEWMKQFWISIKLELRKFKWWWFSEQTRHSSFHECVWVSVCGNCLNELSRNILSYLININISYIEFNREKLHDPECKQRWSENQLTLFIIFYHVNHFAILNNDNVSCPCCCQAASSNHLIIAMTMNKGCFSAANKQLFTQPEKWNWMTMNLRV